MIVINDTGFLMSYVVLINVILDFSSNNTVFLLINLLLKWLARQHKCLITAFSYKRANGNKITLNSLCSKAKQLWFGIQKSNVYFITVWFSRPSLHNAKSSEQILHPNL